MFYPSCTVVTTVVRAMKLTSAQYCVMLVAILKVKYGYSVQVTTRPVQLTSKASLQTVSSTDSYWHDIPDITERVGRELCKAVAQSGIPPTSTFLLTVLKNPISSLKRSFPLVPPRFFPGCYKWRWTKCFGQPQKPLAPNCGVFSPIRSESKACATVPNIDMPRAKMTKENGKSCPCHWPCIPFFNPIQHCRWNGIKTSSDRSSMPVDVWNSGTVYLDHGRASQLCIGMETTKTHRSFFVRHIPVPLVTDEEHVEVGPSPNSCIQWMWQPCDSQVPLSSPGGNCGLQSCFSYNETELEGNESGNTACNSWVKIVKSTKACASFRANNNTSGDPIPKQRSHGNTSNFDLHASANRSHLRKCHTPEFRDSQACRFPLQSLGYDLFKARPVINRQVPLQSLIECNWFAGIALCTAIPPMNSIELNTRTPTATSKSNRLSRGKRIVGAKSYAEFVYFIDLPEASEEAVADVPEVSEEEVEGLSLLEEPRHCGLFGCFPVVNTLNKDAMNLENYGKPVQHPKGGGYVTCLYESGRPVCKFKTITY